MTARIFIKLILGVVGVMALALTAVNYLVTQRVEDTYSDTLKRALTEKAQAIALLLPAPGDRVSEAGFAKLGEAAGARLTWVARDGRVLRDSEADPRNMDNHRNRPEIQAALAGRIGSSLRKSSTFGAPYFYVAIPFEDGALRLSVPSAEVDAGVSAIRRQVLLSVALAFLPSVLLAAAFARYTSWNLGTIIDYAHQLAEGNFRERLRRTGKSEFGVLAAKLNETSEKLEFMMARLEAEHAELQKLEQIRKDFVINVSHELRTPLASIQGYTETLLDGAIHEPANNVKFLNIIRQNAERLTRLTADLLTLSRVELGQQKFQFASYDVNRLIRDNLDSMRPLAAAKHIQLLADPAVERSEVFCDAEAVHQILTNLLDNAIKYTPEGGRVIVGAQPAEGGARPFEGVEIYVRDSGPGIPPQDLQRLFERFYRVDKARSRAMGGTGLGLAIVKHLSRAQGGDVRVESRPEQGSTFYFTLPGRDLGLAETGAIQQELTTS